MKRVIASLAGLALAVGVLSAAWAGPAPHAAGRPLDRKPGVSQKAPSKKEQKLGTQVINLNSASEKDLRQVPGIGKTRAAKIIKARPLASVDDLVSRKIMTARELDKIRTNVTVK
jgi:competence protein ComEA